MTLSYDEPRSGDRYEISFSDTGVFLHGTRHVDRIGRDPIQYDRLSDLPQPAQNEIQHRIWERIHPKRK